MRPADLVGPGLTKLRYRPSDLLAAAAKRDGIDLLAGIDGPWSAWKIELTDAQRERSPAALPLWIVHAPGAHMLWQWHAVCAYHLRPLPGQPPAVLKRANASHEFAIAAIDPKYTPDPDDLDAITGHCLRPVNMIHQVESLTDEHARELLYLLVRAMVNGHTSPDDDYATNNGHMLDATADHLRRGMHEVL